MSSTYALRRNLRIFWVLSVEKRHDKGEVARKQPPPATVHFENKYSIEWVVLSSCRVSMTTVPLDPLASGVVRGSGEPSVSDDCPSNITDLRDT